MRKEMKKQLMLIGILLCILIGTLYFWYGNFVFHSYTDRAEYQYCYNASSEDFIIDGFEIYSKNGVKKMGCERIRITNNSLLKKDDVLIMKVLIDDKQYVQNYKVKADHEVVIMDEKEMNQKVEENTLTSIPYKLMINRDNKKIYDQDGYLKKEKLVHYNGNNKNYSLQNIYVGSSWLKTGDFYSTIHGIEKDYPYITIDYLVSSDESKDINNYERFAYLQGKTNEVLKNNKNQVAFYDEKESLLDQKITCVITLFKDKKGQDKFSFSVDLSPTSKVVDDHVEK